MGKNIAIVVLMGAIGFFGYYAFHLKTEETDKKEITRRVKQKVPVVIYGSDSCRYCLMAKDFMKRKGIQFQERNVNEGNYGAEMQKRTNGARGIPQIFINRKHIGGLSELQTLDKSGKLDELLLGIKQ